MRRGAYGFCPHADFDIPSSALTEAPDSWPDWTFEAPSVDFDDALARVDPSWFIDDQFARLPLQPAGFVEIDLATSRSVLTIDHQLTAEGLLHPGMASTAASLAWWTGRLAMHGAAAVRDGRAIAVLGEREHGKSSTVAWLRGAGWESMTDDVIVVDGRDVLAGPRMVDLRETTASAWDLGESVGQLGQRERWRVRCGPVPPRAELGALVCLEWGDEVTVERLDARACLTELATHNVLQIEPRRPRSLLTLLTVPTFRFVRPRDLARMDEAMSTLLRVVT